MTYRLVTILRWMYFLYIAFLPALAITVYVQGPVANPMFWIIAGMLVVGLYLGLSLELVRFPRKLFPSFFVVFGVPLLVLVAVLLGGYSLPFFFISAFVVEIAGMILMLLFAAIFAGQLLKKRNPPMSFVVLMAVLVLVVSYIIYLFVQKYIAVTNVYALSMFIISIVSCAFRYLRLMFFESTKRNYDTWGLVIAGLAACLFFPIVFSLF